MLIDSHCHLDFPELAGEREAVLARAKAADVGLMLTISTSLENFPRVRAIAEEIDNVYCTVGIHPHEAAAAGDPAALTRQLITLAEHPKVVGFGETGLDYYYDNSPRADQALAFEAHIDAARKTGLPVIVHTRDADADTAAILTRAAAKGGLTGLLHCFSSSAELAETALKIGFYISFSGIVTFKKAEEVRAVAATVPENRILVETDAPFLAPVPHRGKRNEPAFVSHTAKTISELRSSSLEHIEKVTTENFMQLFKKIPDVSGEGVRWRGMA